MFRRIKSWINRYTAMTMLIIGLIVGILFWAGFNFGLAATNTEDFCISCHEMKDFVYEEYKDTVHFNNRSGVRVTCADCHVPKEFWPKMYKKILAVKDVYHNILGTINTAEKFEAYRLKMALNVWDYMKSTDSRECRDCHSFDFMDTEEQDKSAVKKHNKAKDENKTCIDCHKGVAHELPDDWKQAAKDAGLHD